MSRTRVHRITCPFCSGMYPADLDASRELGLSWVWDTFSFGGIIGEVVVSCSIVPGRERLVSVEVRRPEGVLLFQALHLCQGLEVVE